MSCENSGKERDWNARFSLVLVVVYTWWSEHLKQGAKFFKKFLFDLLRFPFVHRRTSKHYNNEKEK